MIGPLGIYEGHKMRLPVRRMDWATAISCTAFLNGFVLEGFDWKPRTRPPKTKKPTYTPKLGKHKCIHQSNDQQPGQQLKKRTSDHVSTLPPAVPCFFACC